MKVIIIEEDQSVYEEEIEESEIPHLLDSGFISAVLKLVEEGIEYANVNYGWKEKDNIISTTLKLTWEVPHKKME